MIVLREKMVCRDGYIGLSYWEIFAQFYYNNVDVFSYCRWIDRKGVVYHTIESMFGRRRRMDI